MILWGFSVGALLGWIAAGFEGYGVVPGAIGGLVAGWALRRAVRAELAAMLARQAQTLAADDRATAPSVRRDLPPPARSVPAAGPWPASPAATAPPIAATAPATDRAGDADTTDGGRRPPAIVGQAIAGVRDWFLGGNSIVRIGLVLLFIGLAFLARWAAGAGLFPIELRLALVAAAGIALLVIGYNRRHARRGFALSLQGGGIAILYLTAFAATALYPVVPLPAAFALMVLFCAGGCALALLQDAESMAAASFAGGYAVPVLLGSGGGPVAVMFGYHLLLNLGVLALAWRRGWRSINLIGFIATFTIGAAWGLSHYRPADFAVAQTFLVLSVLIYLAVAILYARHRPGPLGRVVDSSLLFGVALGGFGLEAALVADHPYGSAFAALGFGAVYIALALGVTRRFGAGYRLLGEVMLAIGIGFATLAIPLALGARWTGSAWALEGAGAFWVGMRQARWISRLFGLLLQIIAALLFLAMVFGDGAPIALLPFANPLFVTGILVAAPLLATAWWLRAPLPHSGSSWAQAYAPFEAVLGKPVFLAGFTLACLAGIVEAARMLPAPIVGGDPVPVFRAAVQQQLAMLVIIAAAWLATFVGRRTGWAVASWPGRVTLLVLFATWIGQSWAGERLLYLPGLVAWLVAIGLHLHLLWWADQAADAGAGRIGGTIRHASHVGGVWLAALFCADCLWLGIDRAGLWNSSWAAIVSLVSATAILAGLTLAAGKAGARWPFDHHRAAYLRDAALPLAVLLYAAALLVALFARGDAPPLPFVPLLNPVELAVLLAIAVLMLWGRTLLASGLPAPRRLGGRAGWLAIAGLGFVAINMMWLRFVHQMLGRPWSSAALLRDEVVQTGLAILWSLLALALMTLAHRRGTRPAWIAGGTLLAMAVAKLFIVDLSGAGGGARIVAFIAVGTLMLVVGYLAPLPPRSAQEKEART